MNSDASGVLADLGWGRRLAAVAGWFNRFPANLLGLFIRVGIANVIWRSGQTKVDVWHVIESALMLIRDEYKISLLAPEFAATLSATGSLLNNSHCLRSGRQVDGRVIFEAGGPKVLSR